MEDIEENLIDTNFIGLPTANNDMFPLDFFSDPIANINLNNNELDIFTRKTYDRSHAFKLFHPPLPLLKPSPLRHHTMQTDLGSWSMNKGKNQLCKSFQSHFLQQINWLRRSYAGFMHESLKNMSKDNNGLSFFLRSLYSDKLKKIKSRAYHQNLTLRISEIVSDIPHDLIAELLDESLLQEMDSLCFNYSLRNCITTYTSGEELFLFRMSGLVLCNLHVDRIAVNAKVKHPQNFYALDLIPVCDVPLGFQAKEMFIVEDLLCLRGNYCFVQYNLSLVNDGKLTEILRLCFDSLIDSIAVNPVVHNEVIVTADSKLACIRGEHQIQHCHSKNKDEYDWLSILYGTSQRTCLVSSENDIVMYDFREPTTSKPCVYLQLPSQYLNRVECLSPVLLWSPLNKHHYITATDQALVTLDERFLNTPVLKINHFMRHTPRYGQALLPQPRNMLVCLHSYSDEPSVCVEICENGTEVINFDGTEHTVNRPHTLYNKPWQFSQYSDWVPLTNHWMYSCESFTKRLKEPVIGGHVATLPNRKHQFACFQQSLVGDVFYQLFSMENGNKSDGVRKNLFDIDPETCTVALFPDLNEKCMQFVEEMAMEFTCEADHKLMGNDSRKKTSSVELNSTIHEERGVSNADGDDAQNLLEDAFMFEQTTCHCPEVCHCATCAITKLENIKNENGLLCRKALSLSPNVDTLKLVNDPQFFPHPLSRVLYENWLGESYTPLDVFAPNLLPDSF